MIEYLIGVAVAIIIGMYILCKSQLYVHRKTCAYCGYNNYLGTNKDYEFKRDHARQYRCLKCGADLFEEEMIENE